MSIEAETMAGSQSDGTTAGERADDGAGARAQAAAPATVASGIAGDFDAWLALNLAEAAPEGAIAPFPPEELMHNTTGLTATRDFASHGVDFLRALQALSPVPLASYRSLLDFGVGVGRLARMFHGFSGRYVGMDVDARHLAWVGQNLAHVEPVLSVPRQPLPAADGSFDAVVSISVFSHLSERDHLFYLSELHRVSAPGALLFLSIHGDRAFARACDETPIFEMLAIPEPELAAARPSMGGGHGYVFIRQDGHLTSAAYDYGITFVSAAYVRAHWSRWFDVVKVGAGALHDFQDVVVLRAR
ncbi:class I SAM-dependent methyltransferase [Xanthobacter sp. YC-JY1]|uniref:class I SAM-dependent methyltransferase n=1 Tax=Xanthobacter sp. YC-JY1 TaxID=2419844 RepID=UPI001F2C9DD5|nr:class I SAM-dependent methyltransferase [Xanthobacter sp. YC-JY1]UJX45057.1 class I SAM-dependent methyltransferase [Xanthobacter sp. YC-JY1]